MKNIILLSFLFLTFTVTSQITITSADMPIEGQIYTVSTANALDNFDLDGGENHLWDYSQLTSTGYDSIEFVSVSQAPFTYQLLFNNIFVPDYLADYARHTDDFEIPNIAEFTSNFEFYQNNPADYRKVGQGSQISGFPTVSQNNPIDIIYRFPMEYGNIDSSYTELDMNVPGILFFHQEIDRHNTVDGWGTLELPLGLYDVIRVRTDLYETDSVHLFTPFEFGINIPLPDVVEYKWFTTGGGVPILTVTENAGYVSDVSYLDFQEPDSTNIDDSIFEVRKSNIKLFPNPVEDQLTLTGIDYNSSNSIQIIDMQGRIVFETKNIYSNVFVIETLNFEVGQYFVKVITDYGIIQEGFVKVK